jgi:hypothetical protein
MQFQDNLGSIIFIIIYLSIIWFFLIKLILQNYQKFKARTKEWKWIFVAYFLLGFGDLFHLGFRIYIFFAGLGPDTHFTNLTIGMGYIISGITMTYFYIAIFHAWISMYGKQFSDPKKIRIYTIILYLAFITRLGLMTLPFNHWYEGDATIDFGFDFRIITSLPIYVIGILSVYLLYRDSKAKLKTQSSNASGKDKANLNASIWYVISYISYSITMFFVSFIPLTGLFMIPKTIAYLVAFYFHYRYILNQPLKEK